MSSYNIENNWDNERLEQNGLPATQNEIIEEKKKNSFQSTINGFKGVARHIYFRYTVKAVAFMLYNAYLIYGITLTWHKTTNYCSGVRFLTVLTGIVYGCTLFSYLYRFILQKPIAQFFNKTDGCRHNWKMRVLTWCLVYSLILIGIGIDASKNPSRLISLGGLFTILVICFCFSKHRKHINWSHIAWGIFLQFIMAMFILRLEVGKDIFQCFADKITAFLDYSNKGSEFVFGYLASGKPTDNLTFPSLFVFSALPPIFFFSFVVSILYYYGIMQVIVRKCGQFLEMTVGTTACESMNASASVFLGMVEAPLLIQPYLKDMTKSEIHCVLTGGFSAVAGAVLAVFIKFGINATHLLSASLMSAPAALAISKLLYPETEETKTRFDQLRKEIRIERNVLEAATKGAASGLRIVGYIVANVIAFLAFLEFVNRTLEFAGNVVAIEGLTFDYFLGKVLTPIAFLMGVPYNDCTTVGELLGLKIFANEFIAYAKLASIKDQLQPRSVTLATYALCGFANFGSVGIMIGVMSGLVPEKSGDYAEVSIRALFGGACACLMTACISGALIDGT